MAGEGPDPDPGADADPCPLCGGTGIPGAPARVTLAGRRRPAAADALTAAAASPAAGEAAALREALARQRRGAAGLQAELEAEAMSMILRLQRDKSEAMMEARQYRRYAEERFAHDAAELAALHDALDRRDAAARALAVRLRACQARLLHLGFPSPPAAASSSLPTSPTAARAGGAHPFSDNDCDGRSVHCLDHPSSDVGTPRTHHLLNRMPTPAPAPAPAPEEADKGVVAYGSPRHARALSGDIASYACRVALADEFPLFASRDMPDGDGDGDDRVYTVDAVHGARGLLLLRGRGRGMGRGGGDSEAQGQAAGMPCRSRSPCSTPSCPWVTRRRRLFCSGRLPSSSAGMPCRSRPSLSRCSPGLNQL